MENDPRPPAHPLAPDFGEVLERDRIENQRLSVAAGLARDPARWHNAPPAGYKESVTPQRFVRAMVCGNSLCHHHGIDVRRVQGTPMVRCTTCRL